MDNEYSALSSLKERNNNPEAAKDPESIKVTRQARKNLQEAIDYVDSLGIQSEKTKPN